MMICDRCKKRAATLLVARQDGKTTKNEGLCIICAKELGLKPITDMINTITTNLNISEEEFEQLTEEMGNLVEKMPLGDLDSITESDEFKALSEYSPLMPMPPELFSKLIGNAGLPAIENNNQGDEFKPGNFDSPRERGKDNRFDKDKDKEEKLKKPNPRRKNLESFCIDLTERAREGKLDNIVGRQKEIDRVIQVLCRRQKNNPCLIGEPGVGKTAIAEALAIKIASRQAPARLEKKEIHLLDLTSIVAGTQFRGQFESRMKGLIEEVKKLGNIILVIDEVHTIVGAGDAEGSMNAANILKPALSRGDIQVIGATTLSEYRRYIEKDSALERRFQPIIVKEPSIEESEKMLMGIKRYYEDFHGIKISKETVKKAVILSERYITDRFLPDKAIDLLDEASSHLVLNSKEIDRIERIGMELEEISAEIEYIESGDGMPKNSESTAEVYHKLADLKSRKLNLLHEFEELSKKRDEIELSTEDLAQVIEKWTDIPASNISENEFSRLNMLDAKLKERLIGQDEAVNAVVRAVKRSRVGISYKRKPVSFIFAGPTGVGKTELVKTLAKELFNTPESLIRLDMSEFMEKFAVSRIIGAPPGYVGYDEAGQLTEKIRRKPYSVILFDEIEKAHPDVLNILLQILDDGRITDAHGREVNFENTIIVMTTNAGSNLNMATLGFTDNESKSLENKTQKALADFLRPEFINRVDEIITFRSLDEKDFAEISTIMLNDLKTALEEKNILFKFTESSAEAIAKKAFSKKYGARNLRRLIQTDVEDKMANLIIENRSKSNLAFYLDADENSNLVVVMQNNPGEQLAYILEKEGK